MFAIDCVCVCICSLCVCICSFTVCMCMCMCMCMFTVSLYKYDLTVHHLLPPCSKPDEMKNNHIFTILSHSSHSFSVEVETILCYIFFTTRRSSHLGYGEINISISTDMVLRPDHTMPYHITLYNPSTTGQCVLLWSTLYVIILSRLIWRRPVQAHIVHCTGQSVLV